MRVQLSYTVEEEDVLAEVAKLIGMGGEDMQQAVDLFRTVQEELKGENDDTDIVNTPRVFEMIEEYRKALFKIDTRLVEALDIVRGYERLQRTPPENSTANLDLEGPPAGPPDEGGGE